ncbi:hypothetical protein ACPW96_05840 [Micromonospora sp. DT81.3]|uniref:hypothetical protein n=1 Tax=Micromonospora sp. DT81.3 TaxID=3416523 RepID=UPI003CEB7550
MFARTPRAPEWSPSAGRAAQSRTLLRPRNSCQPADERLSGDIPTLPLTEIARALTIAVRTTLDTGNDVRDSGGSLY